MDAYLSDRNESILQSNGERTLRICVALSTTQLLPLIHILRHQPVENCQDILLWTADVNRAESASTEQLIKSVAASYPFHAVHQLTGFQLPLARSGCKFFWPLEF